VESGNDYVIQLKNNCSKLKANILNIIEELEPKSKHQTKDTCRGRIDMREYEVFDLKEHEFSDGWKYINSVTRVFRYGKRSGKLYGTVAFYISSKVLSAKRISEGIRGHWKIENLLHREKDVVQNEDSNYIKQKTLAQNVSVLQTLAISVIRLFEGKSLKFANEKYANNIKPTFKLINRKLRI